MLKWVLTLLIALIAFSAMADQLKRWGIGRMPGDFMLKVGARRWPVPLGTTIILSVLAAVIAKFI